MITIETFKRGSTPHHRPTGPIIARQDRHIMTTIAGENKNFEVTFSFFSSFGRVAESSHSA